MIETIQSILLTGALAVGPAPVAVPDTSCAVEIMILGAGQDAGAPQIGQRQDPAWDVPAKRLRASSIALLDHRTGKRYLFDATPDIRDQLNDLDRAFPVPAGKTLGIDGIFLTHAHIGHYAGLMFLGHESAGTSDVPVYGMPRMSRFLRRNGPWSQLVDYGNISIRTVRNQKPILLDTDLTVTPYLVPHRDEYSETVGFSISAGAASALYLPDIDRWDGWEPANGVFAKEFIARHDLAFVDATFFNDNELPGRDMSAIPHPRVTETMELFEDDPQSIREQLYFIHYNHTNPIRDPKSDQSRRVESEGFGIARRGARHCLHKN